MSTFVWPLCFAHSYTDTVKEVDPDQVGLLGPLLLCAYTEKEVRFDKECRRV